MVRAKCVGETLISHCGQTPRSMCWKVCYLKKGLNCQKEYTCEL